MKKILVVEDDVSINKALTIRLRAAGYEVCSAQDGLLATCAAKREIPDAMVLDISMPAGDGFSIVERVQEMPELEGVPFIFLTASKRPEFRERAEELGATAFFEKPYDAAELLAAIEGAVN